MAKHPWVFDTDTHIVEERGTWDSVDRVISSKRLRIRTDNEHHQWLMYGRKRIASVPVLVPGEFDELRIRIRTDPRAWEKALKAREALPPLGLDPKPRYNDLHARLAMMDEMRVERAALYPSLSLFWSLVVEDPDVADAHYRAWNTWVAAETEGLRDRILPAAQFTFHDPKKTVAEIRRCSRLGLRALFVAAVPYRDLPWDDASYEPIWNALEAADMSLILHFTIVRNTSNDPSWEKRLVRSHRGQPLTTFINRSVPAEAALTSLIMGGVLERHTKLRIGVIEFGSIWVPSFLHRLDFTFDFMGPRNRYLRERLPLRPSEYFRRQVKVSTIWNEPLEWLIRSTGDDVLMFASDFPHPEGNAKAVELADGNLGSISKKTRKRFFCDNAAQLFGTTV